MDAVCTKAFNRPKPNRGRVEPGEEISLSKSQFERLRSLGCVVAKSTHETVREAETEAKRFVEEAKASTAAAEAEALSKEPQPEPKPESSAPKRSSRRSRKS